MCVVVTRGNHVGFLRSYWRNVFRLLRSHAPMRWSSTLPICCCAWVSSWHDS